MKYKANPVIVDAFKIVSVGPHIAGIMAATDDGKSRVADHPMLAHYIPIPGDYWVIQEDGYEYVNPKDVFERKYSVLKEPR